MDIYQDGDKSILMNVGKTVIVLLGVMVTAIFVANLVV